MPRTGIPLLMDYQYWHGLVDIFIIEIQLLYNVITSKAEVVFPPP